MKIVRKISKTSLFIGLIFVCMALASLITLKSLTVIPHFIDFPLLEYNLKIDLWSLMLILAYPSWLVASFWGNESMVMSIAFLFFGLGLSLCFKKTICAKIRHN